MDEKDIAISGELHVSIPGESLEQPTEDDQEKKEKAKKKGGKKNLHNKLLGIRGEDAAVRFLEKRGYSILERNWRCDAGEADIIALDDSCIVFVEVKTRKDEDRGLPEEAVGKEKRRTYERIAAAYLKDSDFIDIQVRFDVIAILVMGEDRALIRHNINAFGVRE